MIMKKLTGYTLIELMVTIAVMAIVLSVGLPQMSIFFRSNRMISNTNEIVAALNIARSEAIKRQTRVTMCQSSNQTNCTNTGLWEDGFIVFVDNSPGAVGNANVESGELLLRINEGAEGTQVTVRSDASPNLIANSVTFTSRGVPKDFTGASQSGTFRICDKRGLELIPPANIVTVARGIVLSLTGRVRLTKDAAKIVSCP